MVLICAWVAFGTSPAAVQPSYRVKLAPFTGTALALPQVSAFSQPDSPPPAFAFQTQLHLG